MNVESNIAIHSGTAAWISDGVGFVSTESGALQALPFSVDNRFENASGTHPEELIAAAHACSITKHLSVLLSEAGFIVDRIDTTALLTHEQDRQGFTISRIHLVVTAVIPLADDSTFQSLATRAMENCIVSKLLNMEITLSAQLAEKNTTAGWSDWLDQPRH